MNRPLAKTLSWLLPVLAVMQLGQPAPAVEPSFSQLFSTEQAVRPGSEQLARDLSAKLFNGKGSLLTIPGVEPSPAAAVRPPLTAETLKTLLDDLGLSPTPGNNQPGGPTGYGINFKRSDWTILIGFVLMADGRTILIGAPVAYNVDTSKVTAPQWEELVAANDAIFPCSFSYARNIKQLGIYHTERNIDIKPATMRFWIDQIADVTIATHAKWEPFNNSPPAAK